MNLLNRTLLAVIFLLLLGCATGDLAGTSGLLESDANWPKIKAYAQSIISEREGTLGWSSALSDKENSALKPLKKEGEVWTLVAAADYPNNTLGSILDIQLDESGEIIFYKNRISSKAK